MKLHELFLTQEDRVKKAEQKLKGLKRSIEDGDTPAIHNASSTIEGPAWGDLRKLGWAEKESEPAGGMLYKERWVYSKEAPGPIKLLTKYAVANPGKPIERSTREKVMQPGEATDWVEVDVS